ncbi:2-oxoglutarate dehydrogenase E2 component [Actinokineospora alba]|uniref:Dihydrolipoamide acetyltransferase component of pyruvate dehydrogenase complex n=2 Tax=Actinokineospora TaxID=39845 RepID=A0A1H0JRS1_9PSEU|nr:2-oxoglutarate dehydrogenase, E2 component, dihydrolipoamide succinyltransferase [Actinokineospora alba]TDP68195.1 2-oxoglutarate dehydrogenase E2 component [Actinokineospora alba]SDH93985.1 2-oxoglutarate dehydrogenase E2 component (dihydrolipoamide succinyltransferase) [Actinokineospora alba]SDO46240.1 2-oxoglutarate dehydrogenase E2 component [Actinokineospora alba]
MAFSVEMPALGESVTEGTVTRWLKQEGDTVEVDEPLLEVSTDKVDTEIPSPVAGTLQKIVAQEDETVAVGAELAVIGDGSADSGSSEQQAPEQPAQEQSTVDEPSTEQPAPEPAPQAEAEPSSGATEGPAPDQDAPTGNGKGTDVTMPALGESVTEGTVTRWLKQVGETVEVDEPLLEVSTDKVDTEIPSPVAGTLLEITAGEDTTVDVGGKLGVIGAAGAAPAEAPAPAKAPEPEAPKQAPPVQQAPPAQEAPAPAPAAPAQQAPAQQAPAAPPVSAPANDNAPYVTPLVRKLAAENNIDLASVKGTGVGGRIRKQDVLEAAEAAKAPKPAAAAPAAAPAASKAPTGPDSSLRGTTQKMSRLRQTVSRRMVESLQTAAQLTQVVEVDVTKIAKLRSKAKSAFEQREGVKLTFLPFFAKATVEALKQHPKLNASISEDGTEVTYHGTENLGIAVDTDRGLLTPAIRDAGGLNIAGLAHKIADVAERTRANKVTPDELFGATFNLTNLGSQGALWDSPIIQLPQVGILGVGLVVKRPVVLTDENGDDTIAVRSMVYLALTYDHRLVDGADAGRFLTAVKNRLEEGAFESELGL